MTFSPSPAAGGADIALLTRDPVLSAAAQSAFATGGRVRLNVIQSDMAASAAAIDYDVTRLIIVDINASHHADLLSLQAFMSVVAGRAPVIIITDTFDDAVGRWFLQIRISDFLRKPIDPADLARVCVRVLQAQASHEQKTTRIMSFVPAMGGVGQTSLAIETAMQLMKASATPHSTCLVDLDFQQGACADYLDLDSNLNIDELGPQGERLDDQLLDPMISQHASGLSVLSASVRPAQVTSVAAPVVTRILDVASSRFENVVIDIPRQWRPWTDVVLFGSDRVFVVTDMTVPGLRAARRMTTALAERLQGQVTPEVVVNRFEQTTFFGTGLRRADVEKALEGMLGGFVSNNYKLLREAIDRGVALDQVKADSNFARDLRKILFTPATAAARPLARIA